MGSGLNRLPETFPLSSSPSNNNSTSFSAKDFKKTPQTKLVADPSFSAKDFKKTPQTKLVADLTSALLGNSINSAFKLGNKKKELISKELYFNKSYTIDIILNINDQVQILTENLMIIGYISDKICKLTQDCCLIVKKCFFSKYKTLDLGSEVNTKRVFSILKSLVELFHICKFFKDEGVFVEGKWWSNTSENRYISLIKRKINKKCEAIAENYEKSASEEEGTPSTSDVSNTCVRYKKMIPLETRNGSSDSRLKEKIIDPPKENEKKVSNLEKEFEKNSYEEKKIEENKNELAEKILKLKKKIDLNLDHIEEMPQTYECSSKKIDLNELDFDQILKRHSDMDCIQELSEEKINNQSLKDFTLEEIKNTPRENNKTHIKIITNVLSEITQIKECLREKVIKNKKITDSIESNNDLSNKFIQEKCKLSNEYPINKDKNENIESFDLSDFITNYLNKTYKNVIKSSS